MREAARGPELTLRESRAEAAREELRARLEARSAVVGVVGLGYVGLPLLIAFAEAGLRGVGIDRDGAKCRAISAGRSYLSGVAEETIARLVGSGRMRASESGEALGEAEVIVICVPTPVHRDKRPDLSEVLRAGREVGRRLRPGRLVVLESTCYPGTTEERLRPLLERESGLKAGREFWLAFSPERIDPGNARFGLSNTPKVVGGIEADSTELAALLYAQVVPEVIRVSSPREAEMSKLIENVFRHVNIALANELAMVSERLGVDFWEALGAASSKPFGFMPFYPGPGVGGHCIPVDPHYLSWKAKECECPLRLIETAEEINAAMPRLVAERVVEEINRRGGSMRGARVLLLGMSYKRGVGDIRGSPGLRLLELLEGKGASVCYHDPHVPELRWRGRRLASVPLTEGLLSRQECVVLVTDHDYDAGLLLRASRLLIDTRNQIGGEAPNYVGLWRKNGRGSAARVGRHGHSPGDGDSAEGEACLLGPGRREVEAAGLRGEPGGGGGG
jgi:UDP-N-acetyl-D-glucosamine dehydrogenase